MVKILGPTGIDSADEGLLRGEVAATAAISTPASGFSKELIRLIAERPMPSLKNDGGEEFAVQPWLARQRVGLWNPAGNSSGSPGVFGLVAPTTVGTATARSVATTNRANRMKRLGLVSAATAGSLASAYHNAALQYTCGSGSLDGSGFMLAQTWVPSNAAAVSGERRFVGIQASTAAPTNVEPNTLTNCVGVAQLSTDATQLYLVYGGSAAQTAIALGTNFPGNTLSTVAYELIIFAPWWVANTYYIQLTNLANNAVYTTSLTGSATVVPQSTTLTSWRQWACNNATALAVGHDLGQVYIETTN